MNNTSPILRFPDGWEPPIPFDENAETPFFPVDCLPNPVQDYVKALSVSTQTPPEMAGILSLGVLAVCLQSKFLLEVRPEWHESLSLYTVAIAPPAERKSAVLSGLLSTVYRYEIERRKSEAVEVEQSHQERELLEIELAGAKKRAARASPEERDNLKADVDELTRRLVEFEEKKPYRLLVDDTTPEKLVDLMETAGGAIGMASSEGGVFDTLQGRYDNKSGGLEVFLKCHDGDPLQVDRIGRPGNCIEHPHLSIILTVQPHVLQGLMNNATFEGRGLCARFLYASCRSTVGNREVSPPAIPDSVKQGYHDFIWRLLDMPYRGTLRLSSEADRLRETMQEQVENRLKGDLEDFQHWAGKLVGTLLRIAGLFHAATVEGNPTQEPLSPKCVERAFVFADYLIAHAKIAYQTMDGNGAAAARDAQYILRRLVDVPETTTRDLYRKCRGRFNRVGEMNPGLSILEERGYIRQETVERDGPGRKPSPRILVNPLWLNRDQSRG